MEKFDVIITLTGRRGHGKDTVAQMGIEKFGCFGSVALADWFKRVLAKEFKLPLENFYNENKDKPLEIPIVLRMSNLRHLMKEFGDRGGFSYRADRITLSKWEGRKIDTIRDLMLFYGHEVVSTHAGNDFHCKATEEEGLKTLLSKGREELNIIFVTDARQYEQSKYFSEHYRNVYPVRVVRPDNSTDAHPVEAAVDGYPEGYLFEEIVNDGTLKELEVKVKDLLGRIKEDLSRRYRIGNTVPKKPLTKSKETKPEANNV